MEINELIRDWEAGGNFCRVGEHQIFFVETGDQSGIPVVFLHGYPSCSYDFKRSFELFPAGYRLVAHDHLGFGLSDKPVDYSYSLIEQAEYAIEVWKKLGIRRAHLVAHDYGTSVATELLARRERDQLPIELISVTLCNGSIHIELARLRLIQKLLRHPLLGPVVSKFSVEQIYVRQMRNLWFDKHLCDAVEMKVLWNMFSRNGGRQVIPVITRYLDERYKFWHRWIGSLERLNLPAHILWAQNDPVAVAAIGERLYEEIPGAVITRLDNLGHYPMLENVHSWTSALHEFIHNLKNEE